MAITASDVAVLHKYAEGVMNRAEDHADQVAGIALTLLGAIIWRADPGSIEIKQYAGGLANILWVTISSKRYAFAYNHDAGAIEIRDRTQTGNALYGFSDQNPVADVVAAFRAL